MEKSVDEQKGEVEFKLDVVKFVIDTDTIDNARLMGPSTPLMLFLCDMENDEVYFVCLTDYYDKVIEPRGIDIKEQGSVTVSIPVSNRLSEETAVQVMRLYAARSKLYAMFNLAQFQYRESRYIIEKFANHEFIGSIDANFSTLERFARRLRSMPIWDRQLPWALLPYYRDRLDLIIKNIDADCLDIIKLGISEFLRGNDQAIVPLFEFQNLCKISWEQFSAIGQTFEDIVREWFLPTYVGQLGSGCEPTFRSVKQSD